MWSTRVQELIKEIPDHFGNFINENDPDSIFKSLKNFIIDPKYTKKIITIFSPIVLHLVSDIIVDSISLSSDDLAVVNLLANLIPSFSSIEPLIHFYFTQMPLEDSQNKTEFTYLRSIFRIRRFIGNSFEIKLSTLIELSEISDSQLSEEAWFYLSSLISIIKNLTEDESLSLITSKCPPEKATRLFLEENNFDIESKNLQFENYGPMNYDLRFATSIEGVPFLKSLSPTSSSEGTNIPSSPFARSLALAMLTNKPVLIVGPAGSGKSTLIEQLASIAGSEITALHLGSAVDAKSLLGGYICGEIPGEFQWLDGPLTSAIRANKRWIVLEQIEEASPEVLTLLSPLLSERRLFVPGRSETIKAGYNTRIFATCVKPLDSSLWTKIQVDFLHDEELRAALSSVSANASLFADRVLDSWSLCSLSYHELFRCVRRLDSITIVNTSVSHESYIAMYQITVDTFTSHLANSRKRLELAKEIAKCWDLPDSEAENYLVNAKPTFVRNPFKIGNIELEQIGNPEIVEDFAPTFTSLHHMESVARAISHSESVLLIGETGTGKTTLVQFIASSIGAKLKVINMHHQSDTLDILGGFKPVELLKLLGPVFEDFKTAFRRTFSQTKNATTLEQIAGNFANKEWTKFLKRVRKIAQTSIESKTDISEELRNQWISIKDISTGYLSRPDFLDRDFAFSFVEGPLATAYRTGQWILLDEVNLAPSETLLALAPIIDGHLELPTGELVEKHPDFRLICCMNPATDVGKVNLPETLRHKFVSIFTDETSSESDITLILKQRNVNFDFHKVIFDFYSTAREMSKHTLVDGGGQRVIYSLRALTRAILYMNKAEPIFGPFRACYDALTLSFVSPLSPESSERLIKVLDSMITPDGWPTGQTKKKKNKKKQNDEELISSLQIPEDTKYILVEGFLIQKGPFPIKERKDFILTDTARSYLKLLAQAVFLGRSPVLLQGPTSSGKTTIVKYLADITGHSFVRINNHEHTDMSEYIGSYATSETGKFEFINGALVRAIVEGAWVVLDELNLAPSDVLEALNRLLDDNNQLYVAETQTNYIPAPSFRLFATQNPPGAYGGRKQLSRAFRGRFIEIHVDEIPPAELTQIITERTRIAPDFSKRMVDVFNSLRRQRQFSQIFAGKHAFLTVRDLLRWAFREPDTWISVANEGFALLGERLRTQEEREIVEKTLKKQMKIKNEEIRIENEFDISSVSDELGIVWTSGMIRTVNLLLKCIKHGEPALLVGETGTGKTTAVQVVAHLLKRDLRILNCHQHTETSDFIGAMRPSRSTEGKLFEWVDGSLVEAMKNGDVFLMDEISLAQDSALERLNSVLEPERILAIAEKPEYEIVKANENFVFIGTMNPGGDYGKRELSASLRNRFTEIWVPSIDRDEDLLEILAANSTQEETKGNGILFLQFVRHFTSLSKSLVDISLRDVLQWIRFVDLRVKNGYAFIDSYIQGAFMVFIDCVPPQHRESLISFLQSQLKQREINEFSHDFKIIDDSIFIGDFELPKGPNYDPQPSSGPNFVFDAPTTSQNLLRVGRALQMPLSVLIEGPPGVGKTSLIYSLGQRLGYNVVRINLSEHTEMLDLVGSELPVENGETGNFAWRDGAFLKALKNGDWVILDELNLASQSVLEGLNSCLDHRATLYVPELNMEFKCHPEFKIFGCQNPASAGHGRKSLPRSFLNRFIRVYVDELCAQDFEYIISHSYTSIPLELRKKMIEFVSQLNEMKLDFEFNLRDIFRLCEMINSNISPQKALILLFIQRLRKKSLRDDVMKKLFNIFGEFDPNPTPFLMTKEFFRIGDLIIDRSGSSYLPNDLVIHPSIIPQLEAVLACAHMNWPGLIVGSTATGKSSLIRIAAHISGKKLVEFSMNNSVDTTELLGGFEQMDNHRCFEQLRAKIQPADHESLCQLESIEQPEELYQLIANNSESFSEEIIKEAEELMKRKEDPGRFEWVDGLLLQAMRNGWWIIIDNANLCPPAVLDRLNPLCEPGGFLSLNERGLVEDDIEVVEPHQDFRLFMTVDPKSGEISRAMRNRSIEIYLPSYLERFRSAKDENPESLQISRRLLEEECKDLCGEQGEEFFELMKDCQYQELLDLSAWNLVAYKNFRDQTSVAQLGPDAIHFDIVKCQLTNKQSKMTRSNSSVLNLRRSQVESEENEEENQNETEKDLSLPISLSSPFKFTPMTDSSILSVIYDSCYLFQKEPNDASVRFFLGSSRSCDFESRLVIAENWPKILKVMRELETSDLLTFDEDLPLDKLLWTKPQESLSFYAHFLLLSLNLAQTDLNDIESIDLRLSLSSLVPQFFSELIDKIKFSIQEDSITFQTILALKAIDIFNSRKNESLPLFRFLRSMLKKSGLLIDISPITSVLCPNNSLEASKFRKNLGEPFCFKFEKPFLLWQQINEHWKRIFTESPTSFVAQSPTITKMLYLLVLSQSEATDAVEKQFNKLLNKKLTQNESISFVDRIELDDFQYRDEYRIVNLSTSYPCELLQDLSIRAFIYSIIMHASREEEILIPPDFMIPLDIVAITKSFNDTHNTTDLLSVLCELILHVNKEITIAPSIKTILTILQRKATLLQSEHSKQLNKDTYALLKSIPSIDLDTVKTAFAKLFNAECEKLQIEPIDSNSFKESLFEFAKSKWNKIAKLSEVDDSYYHMVICEITQQINKDLADNEKVMKEIMFSRIGNDNSALIQSIQKEESIVQDIHNKSITKMKFRGKNSNQFAKLKSIVNRIKISDNSDFAKSLDESGTALLLEFPLYRDITVSVVTVMRQLSFAIEYEEPEINRLIPFPFTTDSLLSYLFSLPLNSDNQSITNWSLTFSLIGRTNQVHPPLAGFQIPRTNPEFHTQLEEEKVAQQIEELFNKRKKNELCTYAQHFVNSILNPDDLKPEKLLKMIFKQIKMLDLESPISIQEDIEFLPLLLYIMNNRYKLISNSESKPHQPINIYQKSSVEDISELLRIVRIVLKIVDSLWEKYPNHDTLRQIAKSADNILGQEVDAPLNNFLDALETMMYSIREWQHKDRDFHEILEPIVLLANKLLKMRLESWKQIFESRRESMQENIGQDFYMFFCELLTCTIDTVPELFNKVMLFIELSPIGLLESNLRMIEAFAIYSLRLQVGKVVYSLFINLVYKYRSYLPYVEMYIRSQTYELQKKIKEYVELQEWDINSDKKHILRIDKVKMQINKYCQQHLAVLQLQFKQLIDQFALQIANDVPIPFINESLNNELDEKVDEILNTDEPLRNRVFEARRYINTEMDITSSGSELRSKFAESLIFLFGNKPLYGKEFEKHNKLYGEALVLLEQISILSREPHEDLRDEAQDLFGISENLIILLIEKRASLFIEPNIKRDDVKFHIKQIVLILKSFAELESNESIQQLVDKVDSYTKLQQVPVEDVIKELLEIPNLLTDNYVHYSIALFINNSIEILKEESSKQEEENKKKKGSKVNSQEETKEHLSLMRFVVATMKIFTLSLKNGYGEKDDENEEDQPKEVEGKDGTGLGEGLGQDDITNEIEDEDQLVGDNVNTNNDQQTPEDVEQEGGFEVEPEFDGAADVSTHEEEEQNENDDEMGDADTDEAIDSRKAEDDSKEAEKETELDKDLNKESKDEQEMQKEEDQDDEIDENDQNDDKNKDNDADDKEFELDEPEEDKFESDAANWSENPEEIKMNEDDDRFLNGESDDNNEEEEKDEKVGINIEEEEISEEIPPDIEEIPDEMLGLSAQDKANQENEEDKCDENKEIKGEGKREEIGDGEDGDGKDQEDENNRTTKENEEEDEDEEKEIKEIDKELDIVQKKILKGENLKEGGDGGQRDDEADEGIILPAEEAEDHDKLENQEDEDDKDTDNIEEGGEGKEIEDEEGFRKKNNKNEEEDESDSDQGITHMKFEELPDSFEQQGTTATTINENNNDFNEDQQIVPTEDSKRKWDEIQSKTREGAADLCEQLRLVLQATVAAKMRGDFRTGKRLNMRKIIPFIASGFRKDKIWMRRVQPDQRNYQIFLAVDDSSSMRDNTGEMALESISLITQALTLLEVGDLCVAKFGLNTQIVHRFNEKWNNESGVKLINSFKFNEEKTNYDELLKSAIECLEKEKKTGAMQLCFIISDAALINNREEVRKVVIQAQLKNILVVFVLIDSQDLEKRSSVLETQYFVNGKLINFLDDFPFPFYVLINDPKKLPERLADALRQWFEIANNS